MQLQLNNSGAWKTVIRFDEKDIEAVKAGTHLLGFLSNSHTPFFRITDEDKVVSSWSFPSGWVLG